MVVRTVCLIACLSLAAFVAGAYPAAHQPTSPQADSLEAVERDTLVAGRDTVHALPAVTVLATRARIEPSKAPARVDVLDRTAIEQSGARSAAQLLEDRAGVYMRTHGPGMLASLSMRGGGAAQTLLMIDGHRLTDPQLGQIDFTLLPTEMLETTEVMHGAASPLHGSEGMSGAVNFQTRRSEGESRLVVSSGAGAFGEREGSALFSGAQGAFSGTALLTYRRADNDFEFVDETRFPPETVRRSNADREQMAIYGTLAHEGGRHETRASGWYSSTERGLPGPATSPSREERQWDDQLRFWLDHERDISSGTVAFGGSVDHTRLRFRSPGQDIDDTSRQLTGTLTAEHTRPLGDRWLLVGGVEGKYAQARHPNLQSDAQEGRGSAFISGTGEFGAVTVFPSARLDAHRPAAGATTAAFNPRIGANVQPFGSASSWRFKASMGRSFRQPTMNDRFWEPGGNPDLSPERGWTVDGGAMWSAATLEAEGTLFAHFTRDEIVWLPTGEGFFAPENVRRTRTLGAELSVKHQWSVAEQVQLTSGGTYTLTDARNRSDPEARTFNQPLRQVPRHQVKGHGSAQLGPLTLDVNARYVGRRYVTSDGTQSIDPHFVLDGQVRMAQQFGGTRVNLTVSVDNLLDSDFVVVPNRPMPPRHARALLTVELGGRQ